MEARRDPVDGDVETDSARADKLERIGIPPRIERIERRGPAPVALVEQHQRGGVDGAPVRWMRLGAEAAKICVDESGVDRPGCEFPAREKRVEEGEIGLRPDDDSVVELLPDRRQRLGASRRVSDELGDHRVVIGRDAVAGGDAGIDPHALQPLLALEVHEMDPPRRGKEIVLRVFGVDPRLDRRAGAGDLVLRARQRLAGRDPELPFDQVEAGHRLGHRMLDLKSGVHLEEIEVLRFEAAPRIGDEFDRAGPDIARSERRLDRRLGHGGARFVR